MDREQIIELLQAEYRYWRDCPVPGDDTASGVFMASVGATGALANVIAAVSLDRPEMVYDKIKKGYQCNALK